MKYRIFIDDNPAGATDWLPIAQAAWHRACRDRHAAQHGGDAVLMIDGRIVASVQPRTGEGHPWPVRDDSVIGTRDIAAAVQQLARIAGVSQAQLADELTVMGLPTAPARLKSIASQETGRRTHASAAEIVALCYAAIAALKKSFNDPR